MAALPDLTNKNSVLQALTDNYRAMINAYGNAEAYDIFQQTTKGGMTPAEAVEAMQKAGINIRRVSNGDIITYDTNVTPPIDNIPNKTKLPINADDSLKIGSAADSTKTINTSGMNGSTANSTSSSYGTGSKVKVAINGYNSSKVVDGVYEAQPAKMGVSRKFVDGVEVLDKPKVTLSSNMSSALSMAGSLVNAGVAIGSTFYTVANLIGVDKVKAHLPEEANKFFFGDDTVPTIQELVVRGEAGEDVTASYLNYILEDNFVYNLKYASDNNFFSAGSEEPLHVDCSNVANIFNADIKCPNLYVMTGNYIYNYVNGAKSNSYNRGCGIQLAKGKTAIFAAQIVETGVPVPYGSLGVLAASANIDDLTNAKKVLVDGSLVNADILSFTYDNKTVYFIQYGFSSAGDANTNMRAPANNFILPPTVNYKYADSDILLNGNITTFTSANYKFNAASDLFGFNVAAWMLIYGGYISPSGKIKGLSTIGDTPTWIKPEDDLAGIKAKYRDNYDWLYKNRVETDIIQDDGTEKTYVYIPVPMPIGGEGEEPTTEGLTQGKTEDDWSVKPSDPTTPKVTLDTLLEQISGVKPNPNPKPSGDYRGMAPSDPPLPNPPAPDPPPPTGGGDTPGVIIPAGAAEALWSIYNPTLAQVKQLGGWLWSSSFADQVLKILADPMQAIISCHKIFGTPSINGTGNIKVGYLDSGVSNVNIVDNQYTHIDCGYVNMYEYFGNVFDYAPYTDIQIYLPFVGIVPLRVEDVLRSTISVSYDIDVLTGTCLANINVLRDNAGGVLYSYNGNCAVQYPLSSGSYMGLISTALSITGGFVAGGVAGGLVGGALTAMNTKGTEIKRSGNLSGNAGAMGIKKPYVIISRPITAMAENYQKYMGIPTNSYAKLSDCKGFVKCKEVFISSGSFVSSLMQNMTAEQANEIESLLKQGVIIN